MNALEVQETSEPQRKHLKAFQLETGGSGSRFIQVALSMSAIGELYLENGELERAEEMEMPAELISGAVGYEISKSLKPVDPMEFFVVAGKKCTLWTQRSFVTT